MRVHTGIMAPSHDLRERINAYIGERLPRQGRIAGPVMQTQRLVSRGYTNAKKALASNYAPGDMVAFHRPYKRLGVEKGDERRSERINSGIRTVHLEGPDGSSLACKPSEIGGRKGGTDALRRADGGGSPEGPKRSSLPRIPILPYAHISFGEC